MKNITEVVESIINELDGRKGFEFGDLDEDILDEIKDELVKLILPVVGCSFSIGFAQYIAKEHYKLVNIIGKVHYWGNEESYKTTEQLIKDYKETLG